MVGIRQIRTNYINLKHPTSFGGVTKIQKYYKISRAQAAKALRGVKSYSLHRETKKPHVRNCYFIYQLRQQVQADLIDVSALSDHNDGITFLLTAIDMFSKKLVCLPMKNKSGKETKLAIQKLIKVMKPKQLYTDAGKEFLNQFVQNILARNDIEHLIASSDVKCAGVERVNKTLQRKIYQYMTEKNTDRYIDVLQDAVLSYNKSVHSSINISPNEAEKEENHLIVRDELNKHYTEIVSAKKTPNFKIGDIVRISKLKEQNKEELFEIININSTLPIPMYYLKSLEKLDELEGGFYANELTLFQPDVWDMDVSKPLKKRTHKGVKQVLAKWVGFNEKYDQWIPETNLPKVKKGKKKRK